MTCSVIDKDYSQNENNILMQNMKDFRDYLLNKFGLSNDDILKAAQKIT